MLHKQEQPVDEAPAQESGEFSARGKEEPDRILEVVHLLKEKINETVKLFGDGNSDLAKKTLNNDRSFKQIGDEFAKATTTNQLVNAIFEKNEAVSVSRQDYEKLVREASLYRALKEAIPSTSPLMPLGDSDSIRQAPGLVVIDSAASVGTTAEESTTVDAVAKSGFLADDSWIHALTTREEKLLEPKIMESVGKLLRLKGIVTYPKELGRAAKGPYSWMQETLITPSGPLTSEELQTIPQWIFRRFDARLYQALQDAKKLAKKKSSQQSKLSNGQQVQIHEKFSTP